MSTADRVTGNVGALVAARGLTMALRLGVGAYLARTLAPEGFGVLGFGLSLVSYFSLVVAAGLPTLGTRDVARSPESAQTIAGYIVTLRLLLAVIALAVYAGVVVALPYPTATKAVLLVQGVTLAVQAVDLEWVYQGWERMRVLAVRNVVADVLQVIGVLLLVRRPDDVLAAAAVSTAAVALVAAGLLKSYYRDAGALRLRVDWRVWKELLRDALPLASASLAISVSLNMDKLMIGLIRTPEEVGLYEACYRLLGMSQVAGAILSQAFFPALSAAWGDTPRTLRYLDAFARATLALGLPAVVVGVLLAGPLLTLYAGPAYAGAAGTLSVLFAGSAVTYLNIVYGMPLTAWNLQGAHARAVGLGAGANFILNSLLIPKYGMVGAAWATAASELIVFASVIVPLRSAVGRVSLRPLASGLLLAASVAAAVAAGQRLGWPLLALIAAAGAAYLVVGWASGTLASIYSAFTSLRSDPPPP